MKSIFKPYLKDERKAPKDYKRLLPKLHKASDKRVIKNIIKQERQHYHKLIKMQKRSNPHGIIVGAVAGGVAGYMIGRRRQK